MARGVQRSKPTTKAELQKNYDNLSIKYDKCTRALNAVLTGQTADFTRTWEIPMTEGKYTFSFRAFDLARADHGFVIETVTNPDGATRAHVIPSMSIMFGDLWHACDGPLSPLRALPDMLLACAQDLIDQETSKNSTH